MKPIIILFVLVICSTGTLLAQFKARDVEMSVMGGVGSYTSSYSYTNTFMANTNSTSRNYMVFSLSPAYYIIDGLSLEPEYNLNAVEGSQPSHSILLNISYTYFVEGTKVAPFVHVGYGISNSQGIPFLPNVMFRVSDKLDVTILNAGGGLKILVGSGAALRFEVNYRSYRWDEEYSYNFYYSTYTTSTTKEEYAYSHIGMLVGVSLEL
jgi:hypothetical protein